MVFRLYKSACVIACGGAALYKCLATNNKDISKTTRSWKTKLNASCFAQCSTGANFDVETSDFVWDDNWDQRKTACHLETGASKVFKHLLFIRHGDYNLKGLDDSEKYLTSLGREQADMTGRRLAELGLNYTRIVQSSMTRAMETCGIISKHLPDVEVETTDLLREGSPIPPDPPNRADEPELKYFSDAPRIEAAFRKFVRRPDLDSNKEVEIYVCHANVIRYFICRALQFPPQAWLRMSLRHGSITWITVFSNGDVVVRSIGDAGHMPPSKISR